jgi:protein-tyrosine phosphatase
MIDIHTHILPMFDDGSDSMDASLEMLLGEILNGVTHIICTPHALRSDIKPYSLEDLKAGFNKFKAKIEENYPVKLYLGQEIYVGSNIVTSLRKKEVLTLNDSNYILLELSYSTKPDHLDEIIYACEVLGLKIILAHVERYPYLSIDDIEELSEMGILMQVNSSSVVSNDKNVRNKVSKLFKKNLVNFVASDIHSFRENTLKDAYDLINSKYGEEVANDVFYNNANKLLNIG